MMTRQNVSIRLSSIGGAAAFLLVALASGCLGNSGGQLEDELLWDEHWDGHPEERFEEPELEVGVADDHETDLSHLQLYFDLPSIDVEDCELFARCEMNEILGEPWGHREVCRDGDSRDRG